MNVSVIMTCHNEERFIAQAVESVLNQSAVHRIGEIIIVNDGSTDGSAAAITVLAEKDARIMMLTAGGVGLPVARNIAIKQSSGEYIAILDGDDFWATDKLERQLRAFDAGCQAGLLYTDFVDFSAPDRSDALHVRVRHYHAAQKNTFITYFLHSAPVIPSTVLLRRALLEDVGLFNESYPTQQDTEFFLRVAERWTFQHVPGPLVYKRRHDGNITRRLDALLPVAERITRECVMRRPELAPLARRRMARSYARAGNDCITQGEIKPGLILLKRALKDNPFSWRTYLYLSLAVIPKGLQHQLRRVVKILFHRNRHRRRFVETA